MVMVRLSLYKIYCRPPPRRVEQEDSNLNLVSLDDLSRTKTSISNDKLHSRIFNYSSSMGVGTDYCSIFEDLDCEATQPIPTTVIAIVYDNPLNILDLPELNIPPRWVTRRTMPGMGHTPPPPFTIFISINGLACISSRISRFLTSSLPKGNIQRPLCSEGSSTVNFRCHPQCRNGFNGQFFTS